MDDKELERLNIEEQGSLEQELAARDSFVNSYISDEQAAEEERRVLDLFITDTMNILGVSEISNEALEIIHTKFTHNKTPNDAAKDIMELKSDDKEKLKEDLDSLIAFEKQFEDFLLKEMTFDSAHDMAHIRRVVKNSIQLANFEGAELFVVIPAAWLHDCINVPKTSELRSQGSKLSAERAIQFLEEINYPKRYFDNIYHSIHAHSFSANIDTKTLEAKVVQDADRLDALGALGISRCLMYSANANIPLYDENDPFSLKRELNDKNGAIDHFYTKLSTLPETMKTRAGKFEATERWAFMEKFIEQLKEEITR